MSTSFRSLNFCGREKELKSLKEVVLQEKTTKSGTAAAAKQAPTAVFVQGAPGIGKSSLVNAFLNELDLDDKICWGHAKFQQESTAIAEPFSTVMSLLESLMQQVHRERRASMPSLWEELNQEADDLRRLSSLVPSLASLLAETEGEQNTADVIDAEAPTGRADPSEEEFTTTPFGLKQMVGAWLNLMNIVAKHHKCLILVIDDLQWMDETSAEFLQAMATHELHNTYLIATLREEQNPYAKTLRETFLKNSSSSRDIHLETLSPEDMAKILYARLPGLGANDKAQELAQVLAQKTGGNPLFLSQYLQDLIHSKKLIYFDNFSERWKFDLPGIVALTNVSDNVLELLLAKMGALEKSVQQTLAMAAFLGDAYFQADVLALVLQAYHQHGKGTQLTVEQVETSLCKAEQEGYIEKTIPTSLQKEKDHQDKFLTYKFSHDRIRESAVLLMSTSSDKSRVHLAIGQQILELYRSQSQQQENVKQNRRTSLLFTAVRHSIAGKEEISDSLRPATVEAIEKASEIALSKSCFFLASHLLESAAEILDAAKGWDTCYDLTLRIKTQLVKVSFCCGRQEVATKAIRETIDQAKEIDHTIDVYQVSIRMLEQHGNPKGAVAVTKKVVQELGMTIPKYNLLGRSLKILWKLRKTRLNDEDLTRMASAHNRRDDAIIGFLLEVARISMGQTSLGFTLYVLLAPAEIAIRNGSARQSSSALMAIAVAFAMSKDMRTAVRFAQWGETVIEKTKSYPVDQALAQIGGNQFVIHWAKRYSQCVENSFAGANVLLESGKVDHALLGFIIYCHMYFCSGLNLVPLLKDAKKIVRTAEDCLLNDFKLRATSFYHFISHFTGDKPDPKDEEAVFAEWKTKGSSNMIGQYRTYRMISSYFFDEIDDAKAFENEVKKQDEGSDPMHPFFVLFQGLLGYRLYSSTGKGRRQGDEALARLKKYCKIGNKNTLNMLLLLKAERLATQKKGPAAERVRQAFDEVIRSAAREGVLHVRALANERAGVYHLVIGDDYWASTYLARARQVYVEWGAIGKARQMDIKYGIDSSGLRSSDLAKGGLLSRERVTDNLGSSGIVQQKNLETDLFLGNGRA